MRSALDIYRRALCSLESRVTATQAALECQRDGLVAHDYASFFALTERLSGCVSALATSHSVCCAWRRQVVSEGMERHVAAAWTRVTERIEGLCLQYVENRALVTEALNALSARSAALRLRAPTAPRWCPTPPHGMIHEYV